MPQEVEGWGEYRRLVLKALDELKADVEALRREQGETRSAVVALQVKASIWGGLAGVAGSGIAWLLTR